MSTPEYQPSEFLVKSNIYAHDLIDEMEDVNWRSQGKMTAKNDSESVCGGGKPIGDCATSTEIARQIIGQFVAGIEQEPLNTANPRLFNTVKPVSVDSLCGDCGMLCHAYGKVIDGKPSEKIRFMYEGLETQSQTENTQHQVSQQPIIPTSFDEDFEYFKLEPRQLP